MACTVALVPPPPVDVQLLGPVSVRVEGAPLDVDTRKAVALLAYLVASGRPASRDVLAALLWPEADETSARGALRRTLSVLNAALGPGRLTIDRSAVAIDPGVVASDLGAFRAALARARAHRHDSGESCRRCRAALRAAAVLDRGTFMDGFALRDSEPFDEWLLAEREDYRRELAGALERLARLELSAGDAGAAITVGRRWLELDPLHEPAHRLLMEAHARAGEPAAAVRQYRDCVRTLDRELGVPPLPETTALYEAIRDGAFQVEPGPPSAPQGRPPLEDREPDAASSSLPLVDRTTELTHLRTAIGAIEADGIVIAIEGEAGIGKTRLADAVVREMRDSRGTCLEAVAYAGEAGIGFGPIVALLRAGIAAAGTDRLGPGVRTELARLLPEVAADAPAPADLVGPFALHRLLEAVTTALVELAGGEAPGMLRVDDLQWADESTLETLAYLSRRLSGRPVVVLITFRREDIDERAAPLIARIIGSATTLRLDRLDPVASRELAAVAWRRTAPPTSAALESAVDEAEGLPLYLVELGASDLPADAVPPGIRSLLAGRLADLSEIARQVATAGAILGRSFDAETVRATSGRSDDETVAAIEELVGRGIVREVAGGLDDLDFVHARLRDVAVGSTSLARLRLLHRRAADALRSSAGGGRTARDVREPSSARIARIARHEREAGRDAEAAAAFVEAGELARAAFANREAQGDLEAALALGHPDVEDIHTALGDLRTLAGEYGPAIEHFEAAAAVASPARLGEIEHRLALVHQRRGDPDAADAHFAAALEHEGAGPDRARLLADRGLNAQQAGRADDARRLAAEALAAAEASGDPNAVARAANVAGVLATERGDQSAASDLLGQSLRLAAEAGDAPAQVAALNNLARSLAAAGEIARAIGLTDEALALCRSIGDRHREAALQNSLADLRHATGDEEAAIEHLKTAVAIFAEVGDPDALEPGKWRLVTW